MKAQQDTMNNFFSLNNTTFSIPVYQRNYTWEKQHCDKLLEDIVSICKDVNKTHFMGTITYIIHLKDGYGLGNIQEYEIIDGQQRITTTMLLLKAISTKIKDERIQRQIERILSDDDKTEGRLRLKPILRDRDAFKCVMTNRYNEYAGDSKVKSNYIFFLRELDRYVSDGYDIEQIYAAFLRLKIVGIGLEKGDDDPQIVFESINATGVHLEGVDLIRNFLMMGEESSKQERLYKEYWQQLEEYLKKDSVINEFNDTYLRIYYGASVKKADIYHIFKRHSKEHFPNDIEGLMQDLRDYSRLYQIFINDEFRLIPKDTSNISSRQLASLHIYFRIIVDLKFGVSYPFILQLAYDFEQGELDIENFNAILEMLISYYVRRMICKDETNALNKITYGLYKNLKESGKVNADSLARFLGQKSGKEVFPNDERVKRAFTEYDAYHSRSTKLVLFEIEKLMNAEPPSEEGLTLEHFYPQSATETWRDLVGEEYGILETQYLHTFGNLSLTGQNTTLGNKPFEEKIEILLEKSSLKLNEYFTNMDSWGIRQIIERSEYLAEKFCQVHIFKDLPKEYRIAPISRNLNDDLTFYKFNTLTFPNGEKATAHNAKTLVQAVVDYMYKYHRDTIEEALNEMPKYITFDSNEAKRRDVSGSLSVKCEQGRFFFISSASMRDTRVNLVRFIESAGLNAENFVLSELS